MKSPLTLKSNIEQTKKIVRTLATENGLEKIQNFLTGENVTLAQQIAVLNTANEIIIRTFGGDTRGIGIADDIISTLYANYRRYGEKAYPASDRQMQFVLEEMQSRYLLALQLNEEEQK